VLWELWSGLVLLVSLHPLLLLFLLASIRLLFLHGCISTASEVMSKILLALALLATEGLGQRKGIRPRRHHLAREY